VTTPGPARIPSSGSLRELGLINWAFCRLAARRIRVPEMHLFTTLGIHRRLLWSFLPLGGYLLYAGKLSRRDAEVVILRVANLRDCTYELQQHRRLARSRGLDAELQASIAEGPDAGGLTDRQRALITATDEFVVTRGVSPQTWTRLAGHLSKQQLIEFCMLTAQYDGLAATMSTLNIPLDYPD
jgi:AhpD family alkylhydroperoxidase